MTRKRFVKLLMADGYSRNDANKYADWVVSRKGSYKTSYYATIFAKSISGFGNISTQMVNAMIYAVKAIKAFSADALKVPRSLLGVGKKTSILLCDDLGGQQ